jgi:hypothetical protein
MEDAKEVLPRTGEFVGQAAGGMWWSQTWKNKLAIRQRIITARLVWMGPLRIR